LTLAVVYDGENRPSFVCDQ